MPDRQSDRVTIELETGSLESRMATSPMPRVARPDPETPFRIAILGDFSGRGSRADAVLRDLMDTQPVAVDRDDLDEAIARFAPELHLQLEAEAPPLVLRFRDLEDFHPDRLYERLPFLAALRTLRARLADPRTSAAVVRELLGGEGSGAAGPRAPAPPRSGGALLDAIVMESAGPGSWPAGAEPVHAEPEDELRRFVRQVVAPYLVPGADPRQAELLARLDEATTERMRAILHHPAFQELEALWRGIDFLSRRLETGVQLKLFLLDVTRDELAADQPAATPVEITRLYRLLADPAGSAPWALLVGIYAFGPDGRDAELLGRLAAVARAAGAPWLSAARPALAGWPSFATRPEPEEWESVVAPEWQELRRRPEAAWAGLVAPRFLLRLPYGAAGEACERFDFEEVSPAPRHQAFLWGNPALAAALLLGESFTREGWRLRPGSSAEIVGLPLHITHGAGDATVLPCAESLLPERAAELMLDAGIMPLATLRDRDAVRLVRFQSIALPPTALPGRWSDAGD